MARDGRRTSRQLTRLVGVQLRHKNYGFVSDTKVGAIRLFLAWPLAVADASSFSFSLSLASLSLLTPAEVFGAAPVPAPLLPRGVSGGVVRGTPVTLPEFAAAMDGMLPPIRGGLLMTLEACVAIDDVEFDRAGDVGRTLVNEPVAVPVPVPVGGGEGAANELAEFRC